MKMDGDNWDIIYVPNKESISPSQQPTVSVFVSSIDCKFANVLVRRLNQIAPLENFRHVKRVCKRIGSGEIQLSVILCLACEDDVDLSSMPKDVLELVKSYQLSPFKAKVCKYSATSREEWEEQCKIWPTSYHPPTYNIEGIAGFTEDDSKMVSRFMSFVLELTTSQEGQVVNAAVIVDPSSNQVISSACDGAYSWEMLSCRPIETLASNPLGNGPTSSVKLCSNLVPTGFEKYASVACLHPWDWSNVQPSSGSCWHPIRHAAMVAIESSAARDRSLFPDIINYHGDSCVLDTHQMPTPSPPKKQKIYSEEVVIEESGSSDSLPSKVDKPYLCTGYDMYLAWEPCIMCAMGIIHQRVRRVFYAFPNPSAGALGSVHRLQGVRSLNHHYAVFRVMVPDEEQKFPS